MEIVTLSGDQTSRLIPILRELAAYHNTVAEDFSGVYPVYSLERQMEEAGEMVDKGEAQIDVVLENGEIAGFGMASFSGKNGEIEFLYLRPHLRRRGLGDKLYQRLAAFLEANGVEFVDLLVVKGNPAKRFYRKRGFRVRSELMSLSFRREPQTATSATPTDCPPPCSPENPTDGACPEISG